MGEGFSFGQRRASWILNTATADRFQGDARACEAPDRTRQNSDAKLCRYQTESHLSSGDLLQSFGLEPSVGTLR